jgi:signal transduction histidine kinase/pSer/pThr/pTyr-binding forkhead associated (FHA) protein
MASLFVIQGRDQGRRFDLPAASWTIGRDAANPIQLRDHEASRRHAEVHGEDGEFEIVDLQSSNGTWVNGKRVERHTLRTGDRVQIGRTLLLFTGASDDNVPSVAEQVNIVRSRGDSNSRIVTSLSPEESQRMLEFDASSSSPWLARARSNLQVMYRTALAVSHTLDIDELLDRIMELIFEWVEADRGCIMLVDRDTEELKPAVRKDRKARSADEKLTISRTILDYVMQHKEGVLTSDASEDTRWDQAQSIVCAGVREAICVPMQGRYGIVGVIYIDTFTPPGRVLAQRNANKFTDEHLKLMVAIAHQAALAVEDTSYYSAMVQAERLAAMGQTIATLSHHIKNILQGIRGGSFLIDEGLKRDDNEAVRRGWRIVEKNQDKISNLVMDMLAFSKEREPEPAPNDWNELANDCVELMQSRAREASVELQYRPAADIPELVFDADLLHRAVLNVVTNAIDACEKAPGGGRVLVSTRYLPATQRVNVSVQDNGEGIAPEDIKRIFSVFESRKGSRGTGLGLPVSQKIVREHGGEIQIDSTLGSGSCFTLEIPAVLPSECAGRETLMGMELPETLE